MRELGSRAVHTQSPDFEGRSDMSREKILVVDDDAVIRGLLENSLRLHELEVASASDGAMALEMATQEEHAVAIVDLEMPGMFGTEVIRRLKKLRPHVEVIIFTGNPSFESSIDAIHQQVFDYVCKPADMRTILKTVRKALEHRRLILENQDLLGKLEAERNQLQQEVNAARRALEYRLRSSPAFLGQTTAAQEIRHEIAKVASSNVSVLLLGESGTGKDVIAQLIHESSGRDPHAFIKVNCPAIPESLLESEFFGYEAGAFTGATKRKPGRFELAAGGTIFLDEIGDLPFPLQSKLLQAVEQKQFYRVGGKKPIHVDVRIIAATNAPLADMIGSGRFRADLFYRLNEFTIRVAPLRERKEDIPLLADHFLAEYKKQFDCPDREIPPDARAQLCSYDWPGNVRELQSVIRRFALTGQQDLFPPSRNTASAPGKGAALQWPAPLKEPQSGPAHGNSDLMVVLDSLSEAKWNRRQAAKALGISYSTLRRRIYQYNLKDM